MRVIHMYKYLLPLFLVLLSSQTMAQDNKTVASLAGQNGCLVCHQTAIKLVGPSFQSVAEKYQNQVDAQKLLVSKVRNGGAGAWGKIPMPAHPQVTEENTSLIIAWILKGAPAN
jgi:cytochrome c